MEEAHQGEKSDREERRRKKRGGSMEKSLREKGRVEKLKEKGIDSDHVLKQQHTKHVGITNFTNQSEVKGP